jgi:hypothetical protein
VLSLFYLTPPVTALRLMAAFGERLERCRFSAWRVCVTGVFLGELAHPPRRSHEAVSSPEEFRHLYPLSGPRWRARLM